MCEDWTCFDFVSVLSPAYLPHLVHGGKAMNEEGGEQGPMKTRKKGSQLTG
jgi:hypothetical protein